ncbi:MAG: nodulation protein NfeD [Bacteroidales bacterium]|nr:nodulation protein NfeD [Bacteroidales bacterium]
MRRLLTYLLLPFFLLAVSRHGLLAADTLAVPVTVPPSGLAPADSLAADTSALPAKKTIYKFDIKQEVGPALLRIVRQSMEEAQRLDADLIVVHMNTYGGQLDAADSIRTRLLRSPVPVYVFVDNNAISAGALIAIAADKIYMCEGAAFGAATVVDQTGKPLPDKYQSFMRALMRSTAESHGRDTLVTAGDTVYTWRRDPLIAEAMVDPRTVVEGVVDSSRVLTLTTGEALRLGYCEGRAASIAEMLEAEGIADYEMHAYTLTPLERIIGWMVNPALQGLLIMALIGGIYFEFRTPGIGFPLIVALLAALLYFAPLYLEGLAAHWEILLFIVGVVLIAVEIFVIPGFGVAGVTGALCMVAGLTLSLVDNVVFSWEFSYAIRELLRQAALVTVSLTLAVLVLLWIAPRFLRRTTLEGIALRAEQSRDEGFVSVSLPDSLPGSIGTALTMLRPSGKVLVDGQSYDAVAQYGYIEKGDTVRVLRTEAGQLYVTRPGNRPTQNPTAYED